MIMGLYSLATKRAKPNGVFEITASDAVSHLDQLPVADLPGVGYRSRSIPRLQPSISIFHPSLP